MKRKANVIAVMSPKGGVGKTVTTANLAAALSTTFNKKVLAIDTNVSTASLGLHLDIFYPKTTLNDLTGKKHLISKAIHLYDENLHVIPASIKIRKQDKNIKTFRSNLSKLVNQYEKLLENFSKEYDLVLLDCAPGFDLEAIAALHVAGALILVTNPEYPAIVSAAKAAEYARISKVPMGGIVLNKIRNKKYELSEEDIEKALGIKIIERIPMDKKIPQSIANRTPVVLFRPKSKSGKAYTRLAATILGEEPKEKLSRIKKFLKRKKKVNKK